MSKETISSGEPARTKVCDVLLIPAFRRSVLKVKDQNPLDHSSMVWNISEDFTTYRVTEFKPNNTHYAFREDISANCRRLGKTPIKAIAIARMMEQGILAPTKEDLQELTKVWQLTPFKNTFTWVECGFKAGSSNVEFLSLKPREDHGTQTSSRLLENTERLSRALSRVNTQPQVNAAIDRYNFSVFYFKISFETLTAETARFKKNFKF